MALELPADLEVFGDFEQFHDPCVYCLTIEKPADDSTLAREWDRHFDVRPAWFDEFAQARDVFYVGATGDCLSRLEDHRDGEVRQTALTTVCEIDELRNVWWFRDVDHAFENESQLAILLQNEHPEAFVRQA